MTGALLKRFTLIIFGVVIASAISACGDEEAPRSLNSLLLERSELPPAVPTLRESASNAGLDRFVKASGAHTGEQSRNLKRQLRSLGFVRGSARRYQAQTGEARILVLIESVAELKEGSAAKKMVEQTYGRAGKRPAEIDIEFGEFSRSYKAEVANVPVYVFAWKEGKLFFYFSLSSNRNGGPSQKAVEALATKASRKDEQR